MDQIHSSHVGIEACLRRARECLYWPAMNSEIRDFIVACEICNSMPKKQQEETLVPHDVPGRPWATVGTNLCYIDWLNYLVTADYHSNFIEVDYLEDTRAETVFTKLKAQFSRYGIPDSVVSDNGPQFSCDVFANFSRKWGFEHNTSSLRYPQSNGKVENAVKTIKNLIMKSKMAKSYPYLAILDFRNTPTQRVGSSPAQRIFGRRTKTLLPTTAALLNPRGLPHDCERERITLLKHKSAKDLRELSQIDVVRVQPAPEGKWVKGCGTIQGDGVGRK
ncbi:PREDICTED: uncharacterized protein K02A2.6-like [Priapulus caudatus]|uniref:RNA-directed DNA polymerase n=1 Tax=Priapulus caudatus TaxID=37621 RepID=A0ABM1EAX9_PRICU|nr:PREDICTED: uncharacterized protein K02A2.6-like [Priapulus caudatus]